MFKLLLNLAKDAAAQWFQYRTLLRVLLVKLYLRNIKAIDNDDYTFCGNSAETIKHILISCSHSLAMWIQYSTQIYNTTLERIGLKILNVIFRDCPLLDTNIVVNFLIFMENYTFFTVLNKTNFHFYLVKKGNMILKNVYLLNSEMNIFDKKWCLWKNIFQE